MIIIHVYLMKDVFIPNHLASFYCGVCSHLEEIGPLFKRLQELSCAKVELTVIVMFE